MNALDPNQLSFWAALVAGFAGSGHCLAMCGGIAGALAMRGHTGTTAATGWSTRLGTALAYNVARVASYAVAGAVAGLLGQTLLRAVDLAPVSIALRLLAGAVMIAAAGRLLFGWRLLNPLEAAGARLWRKVLPWASPRDARRRDGVGGAIALGLAWGWLPCGLTYSMLLLAATTASVAAGALVMVAFGLGTLPAMVSATVAFERAARLLASRATLRVAAGSLLLAFGAWTAGNAAYHSLAHGGQHGGHASSGDAANPHAGHSMPATADPHAGHAMPATGEPDAGHDTTAGANPHAGHPAPAHDSEATQAAADGH